MSKLDEICKFKIGDHVTTKTMNALTPEKRRFYDTAPQLMQITERVAQECYGGLQVNYLVRITATDARGTMGVVRETFSFTEPELMLWSERKIPTEE